MNRPVFGAGLSRLRGVGLLLATGGLLAVPAAHAAPAGSGAARLSGHAHAHAASATVPATRIEDVAHLSGGYRPTGQVTFALYGPFSSAATVVCTGPDLYTGPAVPVTGDGNYASADFTPPAPGLYQWVASYSGDGNNNPVTGTCGDPSEAITVAPAPHHCRCSAPVGHRASNDNAPR